MSDGHCEIEWFEGAALTPDNNPAIGRVRRREFTLTTVETEGAKRTERRTHLPAGRWMRICAEHAKRMDEPVLAGKWEWEFEGEET